MALTNFPNGISSFGIPVYGSGGYPGIAVPTGNVWFVNSVNGANGNAGTSAQYPFATLAYAITQATASNGDIIYLEPGHAETYSTATALTLSKAGITIIGLGNGSMRPTFTFDTIIGATINVTAANVTIANCIFTANFADVTSFFTLTTAKFFTLDSCYFKATAVNMNSTYVVDTNATTNDADGLQITNCQWIEVDTATIGWVKMDGTNDNVIFSRNFSNLGVNDNKALIMVANGKVVTNLQMTYNNTIRLQTDSATGAFLFHTNGSTNTGIVAGNFTQHAEAAAEIIVTASSGLSLFQNYSSGVNGNSGYVIATIDT